SKLAQNAPMIAIALAVILVARPIAGFVLARLLRQTPRTAVNAGLALAPIGEFSFIVATLGKELGILPAAALDVVVASAIVSITLAPILTRLVDPIARSLERVMRSEPATTPPLPKLSARSENLSG